VKNVKFVFDNNALLAIISGKPLGGWIIILLKFSLS